MKRSEVALAADRVRDKIAANTNQNSLYSRGLASEGFLGGYAAALSDVQSVMQKLPPSRRPEFWK